MKKKKMGFTLVELLAVIVILTVILVIAVPRITDVINNSKKATFESSAKTIASQAENKKMEQDLLDVNNPVNCSTIVNLSSADYASCSINFENGTAYVTLYGSGKFEGLQITDGTKESAVAVEIKAPDYGNAVNYVSGLYAYAASANGLKKDNTVDANIRYYGADPNNYVKFKDSDDVWRIIGIFDGYVKLIRSETIGKMQWSTNVDGANAGAGINQWGPSTYTTGEEYVGADLQVYLNGTYFNDKLSEITKSAIDYHLWNTAGVEGDLNTVIFYNAERGTLTGKECTNSVWCNDTVNRTTTWNGYIALPYVTDWAYASATSGCETESVYTCYIDNWLNHINDRIWTLSPAVYSDYADSVWYVYSGAGSDRNASDSCAVFPAVYLKSNVKIIDGKGTGGNPYILDIE